MPRAPLVAILVALVAAPALLSPWALAQLTFVAIYVIAGSGLMLLAGYAGQLSLCHAAFVGVGAYAAALLQQHGWPLVATLPAAAVLGIATPRLKLVAFALAAALGGLAGALYAHQLRFVSPEQFDWVMSIELFAFGFVLVLTLRFAPAGLADSLRRLRSP